MSQLVENLLCSYVKALQPYQSARRLYSGGQDWLNANESPFANDYQLDSSKLNRYPSCQPTSVINAYASYAGVKPEQTLVSRGADEGIELLVRAFCEPGKDSVLICPPTYGMYAISAQTFNVGVEQVPLNDDFSLNTDAMCALVGKVKVVFICSPNNPTGTDVPAAQIEAVLNAFADSAIVVVDEAYIEFSSAQSWASKLAQYPNLVVLRTLSKAFALAGIRCGFTLASAEIIQALLKVIAPYPLPEPVAQIAAQALSDESILHIKQQIAILDQQKGKLLYNLLEMPQFEQIGDSAANFILLRAAQREGLMNYLVSHGILIRDQSRQLNLQDCLRITVGSDEQNQRLLEAIQRFYQSEQA